MSRRIRLVLGALVLASQLGCLIWPFPTGHLLAGRGRITKEYAAPLQPGVATREEVLLRLGEPDEVLEGGKVFIYHWTEARGFIALGAYGSGALIPFPGHRAVRLEFNADGRLLYLSFERGAVEVPRHPLGHDLRVTTVPGGVGNQGGDQQREFHHLAGQQAHGSPWVGIHRSVDIRDIKVNSAGGEPWEGKIKALSGPGRGVGIPVPRLAAMDTSALWWGSVQGS